MDEQIVFVVYDSIENSVFYGQVLTPLIKKKRANPALDITLVTFEKNHPSDALIQLIQDYHINLVIHKRMPFLGTMFLYALVHKLRTTLHTKIKQRPYTLIARGPHAGWISMKAALEHARCKNIVVQARGLLAHEFAYVQSKKEDKGIMRSIFLHLRYGQYTTLERFVYQNIERYTKEKPIHIEAVSPHLQEYLMITYGINASLFSIATDDVPASITLEQKQQWRQQVRAELKIAPDTHVICYNGSAKSWQCPEYVIRYFKQLIAQQQNCFLLIVTQNKLRFMQLLQKEQINPSRYFICHVAHEQVFRLLASCDAGILFREPNLINWVSRPTKMLEYQAVHLPIIHNQTVALLAENNNHIPYNHQNFICQI